MLNENSQTLSKSNLGALLVNCEEKTPERKAFDVAVELLLRRPTLPISDALFRYLNRTLRQFRLNHKYDVFDIFSHAYMRGARLTNNGTPIERPEAWIRRTSFNVIRELKRAQKSQQEIDLDCVEHKVKAPESTVISELELELIWKSIVDRYDPVDVYIVLSRAIDEWSWEEISDQIVNVHQVEINPTTLRKRYSRLRVRMKEQLSHLKDRYSSQYTDYSH